MSEIPLQREELLLTRRAYELAITHVDEAIRKMVSDPVTKGFTGPLYRELSQLRQMHATLRVWTGDED